MRVAAIGCQSVYATGTHAMVSRVKVGMELRRAPARAAVLRPALRQGELSHNNSAAHRACLTFAHAACVS